MLVETCLTWVKFLLGSGWLLWQFYLISHPFPPMIQQPVHVLFALSMVLLWVPLNLSWMDKRLSRFIDILLLLLVAASAWYIFSALGFYPVNPASGEYIIGSPLIDRAAINVGNGRKFEIIVNKESDENAIYVDKITINGKEITDFKLPHKAIVDGGTLQIWLTSK